MKARSSEGEQVQNISEETRTKQKKLLKKALEAFDKRNPDVHGARRDLVRTRYWFCIIYGGENPVFPSDSVVLKPINTTMSTYDYEFLEHNQDGTFDVHCKKTKEPLENITLTQYKNFDEFKRKCIRGKIFNEQNLSEKFLKIKKEQEEIDNSIKELKSNIDDEEYEDLIIPKSKPK